ncbi:MAG TPA: hypothetical protein VHX52_06220 [Steroidobacteraceae bacterium]|jgi:hypothetical protein|nr:hypothetical protein [Steroidobacteraceae bacterium]
MLGSEVSSPMSSNKHQILVLIDPMRTMATKRPSTFIGQRELRMHSSQGGQKTVTQGAASLLWATALMLAVTSFSALAQSQNAASADGSGATGTASAAPIAVTLKFPVILPGVGIDVTGAFNHYLDARVGYSDLPYTYHKSGTLSASNGGFGYSGQSEDSAWDFLLDYKPFGGTFRLTGGIYGPNEGLKVTGVPTQAGTFTINGDAYSTTDVNNLRGKAGWYNVSPYVGLGRDGFNKASKNHPFYFSFDVGVILARPKGTLNYTCTASAAVCSNLATDVAAQQNKLDTTIGSITVLPLLQVGVGYRF